MKYTVTIPETIVTLEATNGTLPEGTTVLLSVPIRKVDAQPVPTPQPIPIPDATPTPTPTPTQPAPEPIPTTDPDLIRERYPEPLRPQPTFERVYPDPEFRNKRFDTLGKAPDLGLDDANWTILLEVRFVTFKGHQRVIGSATTSGNGSSLQIGVLNGGMLWIDTFGGAATGPQLELNRWYKLAVTHNRAGEEVFYLDGEEVSRGRVPVFKSKADIYVGRWVNTYADFDLRRVAIFPLLGNEEVKLL